MNGVARIDDAAGGIILPARSAYDRQLVLECLRQRVRRSASVRLELDGRRWSVTLPPPPLQRACARCQHSACVYRINDARADGPLCAACLGSLLRAVPDPSPHSAAPSKNEDVPLADAAAGHASSPAAAGRTVSSKETPPWQHST